MKRSERKRLTERIGRCTVRVYETIVIQCASDSLADAKSYIEEQGYMVTGQRHPGKKDVCGPDVTSVIVTGERKLTL